MKSNSEYYTLNLESMPKSLGCQSMVLLEDDGTFKMWNLVGGNKIFGRSGFGRNTGVLNNSSCSVCILVAIKGSFLSHIFKTWYPIIRSPRQQSQMTIKQKKFKHRGQSAPFFHLPNWLFDSKYIYAVLSSKKK